MFPPLMFHLTAHRFTALPVFSPTSVYNFINPFTLALLLTSFTTPTNARALSLSQYQHFRSDESCTCDSKREGYISQQESSKAL